MLHLQIQGHSGLVEEARRTLTVSGSPWWSAASAITERCEVISIASSGCTQRGLRRTKVDRILGDYVVCIKTVLLRNISRYSE